MLGKVKGGLKLIKYIVTMCTTRALDTMDVLRKQCFREGSWAATPAWHDLHTYDQ